MGKVLWSETYNGKLTAADLDELERRLEIKMPWYFKSHEWVVGYRVLETTDAGATYLRAVRVRESKDIAFELITSLSSERSQNYAQLHRDLRAELGRLRRSQGGTPPMRAVKADDDRRRRAAEESARSALDNLDVTSLVFALIGAGDVGIERARAIVAAAQRVLPDLHRDPELLATSTRERLTAEVEGLMSDARKAQERFERRASELRAEARALPKGIDFQLKVFQEDLTRIRRRLALEMRDLQVDPKRLLASAETELKSIPARVADLQSAMNVLVEESVHRADDLTREQVQVLAELVARGERVAANLRAEAAGAGARSTAKAVPAKKAPAKKVAKKAPAKKAPAKKAAAKKSSA